MVTALIIGGNRGIGLALVKQLGEDPRNTVIATARKGSDLSGIEGLGYPNVKVVFVDLGSPVELIKEAFSSLEELTPGGIDLVIHSAATSADTVRQPLHSHPIEPFDTLFPINVTGIVKVYQGIYPRLETNGKPLKYAVVSSLAGKISDQSIAAGAYGASKAAANYIVKQISGERKHKGDIVIPIHPGLVETDLTVKFIDQDSKYFTPVKPAESARKILSVIGKLTPEDTGKFFDSDGIEWDF